MEVRSCRGCGKLYNYLGPATPACPSCMQAMEERFQVCKEYIRSNPGANIQKVSEATETPAKMIKQWVREERLIFTEGSGVGIECESCGASILTGRFCSNCKGRMTQTLMNSVKKEAPVKVEKKKESDKMRFLDR